MLNIGLLFVRIYYIYMCMYIYIDMYIYIYICKQVDISTYGYIIILYVIYVIER